MNYIYLYLGQIAVSAEVIEIKTILGSCVAVALYDPKLKIGGLNHYLLPHGMQNTDNSLRYGQNSITALIAEMQKYGADLNRLQAKVYGGGAVISSITAENSVGDKNIALAINMLNKYKIPIIEQNTGGKQGRKISLFTETFVIKHELMNNEQVNLTDVKIPEIAKQVRVLIVDDSITVRQIFLKILSADKRISVIGIAPDAFAARELLVKEKPNVILLDIEMPKMNGVQFLEKIMTYQPTPVIMVSSLGSNEEAAIKCLEIGAIEFVHKPSQFDNTVLKSLADSLINKIIAVASMPLHKNIFNPKLKIHNKEEISTIINNDMSTSKTNSESIPKRASTFEYKSQIIVVGGNIGAQNGLIEFLNSLATDTPPVIISVSSITAIISSFINKAQVFSKVRINLALDNITPLQGNAYICPAEHNIYLSKNSTGGYKINLKKTHACCSQLPSTEILFNSLADTSNELSNVISILLSGFGTDGVNALTRLCDAGAHTIVVNPKTAPFSFVPNSAISLGTAKYILEPKEIGNTILKIRNKLINI